MNPFRTWRGAGGRTAPGEHLTASARVRADRLPDVRPVSAVPWSDPAAVDLVADVPAAGVFLGADRTGMPVNLPIVGHGLIRIGLPNASALAFLLTYRLLAVGSHVTVVTPGRPQWTALQTSVPTPQLTVSADPPPWPPTLDEPPGAGSAHQTLVADLPDPPPSWLGGPWCTVLHAPPDPPPSGSAFWRSADLLLLTGHEQAALVDSRWHRSDPVVAHLKSGQVAVADAHGSTAVSIPLTPYERNLLSMGR